MIKCRITIEGIDKTGKTLIVNYIDRLTNHKYITQARGILSHVAYSMLYSRGYEYDLTEHKRDIIFYLTADKEDLEVRFALSGEKEIDIDANLKAFEDAIDLLIRNDVTVISFNTSEQSPYQIAKAIIHIMEALEAE
jgi:thymidylate kinase